MEGADLHGISSKESLDHYGGCGLEMDSLGSLHVISSFVVAVSYVRLLAPIIES